VTTILHIATRLARGGSERRVIDWIAALPELRHVVLAGQLDEHRTFDAPAEIRQIAHLKREIGPHDLLALVQVWRAIRTCGPSIVVTHQSKAGVVGRLAGALAGIPVVHSLSMDTFSRSRALRARAFQATEQVTARWTQHYVASGYELTDIYRRLGVPASRLRAVRTSLQLEPYFTLAEADRIAVRRRLRIPMTAKVVLWVGSLDERKDPFLAVQAFHALQRSEGSDWHMVMLGDGPLRDDLEEESTRALPGTIHLEGHVALPAPYFAAADVILLTSREEGVPQVLVQAGAAGLPIASADCCGAFEAICISGAESAVVAQPTSEEFARSVRGLSNSPSVREHSGRWADSAIRRQRFSAWTEESVHADIRAIAEPLVRRGQQELSESRQSRRRTRPRNTAQVVRFGGSPPPREVQP
jgi:glycosyltransferase involved in cell wall biosynthesis